MKEKASKIDYSTLPPECDELCEWRHCLHKGENKGPYSQGRGYTSYYETPQYVCMTRMHTGCPPGPLTYGRPTPDYGAMFTKLCNEANKAKCTQKVKRVMLRHIHLLRLIVSGA